MLHWCDQAPVHHVAPSQQEGEGAGCAVDAQAAAVEDGRGFAGPDDTVSGCTGEAGVAKTPSRAASGEGLLDGMLRLTDRVMRYSPDVSPGRERSAGMRRAPELQSPAARPASTPFRVDRPMVGREARAEREERGIPISRSEADEKGGGTRAGLDEVWARIGAVEGRLSGLEGMAVLREDGAGLESRLVRLERAMVDGRERAAAAPPGEAAEDRRSAHTERVATPPDVGRTDGEATSLLHAERRDDGSRPDPGNARLAPSEDILGTVLDSMRGELERVKRAAVDEATLAAKDSSLQLAAQMARLSAQVDQVAKGVPGKIAEMRKEIQEEMEAFRAGIRDGVGKDSKVLADAEVRLRTVEGRVDALTRAPRSVPQMTLTPDGKLDLTPLYEQLGQLGLQGGDLEERVRAVESRPSITASQLAQVSGAVERHEQRFALVERTLASSAAAERDMLTAYNELRAHDRSREFDESIRDVRDRAAALQDEVRTQGEQISRLVKDVVQCRASINTLRTHTEECVDLVDGAKKGADQLRADVASYDQRLCKVLEFAEASVRDLDASFAEIRILAERTADRVDDVEGKVRASSSSTAAKAPAQSASRGALVRQPSRTEACTSPRGNAVLSEGLAPAPEPMPVSAVVSGGESGVVAVPARRDSIEVLARRLPRLTRPSIGPSPALARQDAPMLAFDVKRFADLPPRVERLDGQVGVLQRGLDGIRERVGTLETRKSDEETLTALFEQFRMAMAELNHRIGAIRKGLALKADSAELLTLRREVLRERVVSGDAAAVTEGVHCLVCGAARQGLAQALPADKFAVSTRISGVDRGECFVYTDRGEVFRGRSDGGRPVFIQSDGGEGDELMRKGGGGRKATESPRGGDMGPGSTE